VDDRKPLPDGGEMRVTTVRHSYAIKEWAKLYQQQAKEVQDRTFMTDPEMLCHAWSWVGRCRTL
jgi:hypothetical protein